MNSEWNQLKIVLVGYEKGNDSEEAKNKWVIKEKVNSIVNYRNKYSLIFSKLNNIPVKFYCNALLLFSYPRTNINFGTINFVSFFIGEIY